MATRDLQSHASLKGLSSRVQNWISERGWRELHPIQEQAIPALLDAFRSKEVPDFVISAPTATGKTEAVFIPLASLVDKESRAAGAGADILYICPLTALIDQQAARLQEGLFSETHPVIPWHATSKQAAKKKFESSPSGVIIITPESLESQFINRSTHLKSFYGALWCVVIDEFHAFFNNERGYQLLSQLSRLELVTGRALPRLALSATFNESTKSTIARRLRPESPAAVRFLVDDHSKRNLECRVSCFGSTGAKEAGTDSQSSEKQNERVASAIFEDLQSLEKNQSRESNKALVFVNSRQDVERFSRSLTNLATSHKSHVSFYAHHGSLSPDVKEKAIRAIRDKSLNSVVVCTTTLELGIDIGAIERVCQVDPGSSVSSLHQRLGRSGRRHGELSRLTVYVREPRSKSQRSVLADLHLPTFQTLAQISLVRKKAYEPPDSRPAHLSTLLQQILSLAAQNGSRVTQDLVRDRIVEKGPFEALRAAKDKDGHLVLMFARLQQADLLELEEFDTRNYRLTSRAQQMMANYTFYAAFDSGSDFNVYSPDGLLGTMPAGTATRVGDRIIFANRLWTITSIMRDTRTIRVMPAPSGQAPIFPGDPIPPSQAVVSEMQAFYASEIDVKGIGLNADAMRFYEEGSATYAKMNSLIVSEQNGVLLFPWLDLRGQSSLLYALRHWGLHAAAASLAIFVDNVTEKEVVELLEGLADGSKPCPNGPEAMRNANSVLIHKHDYRLSPYLQRWNAASFHLDMAAVPEIAGRLLTGGRSEARGKSRSSFKSLTPQASKDAPKRRQTSSKSASMVRKRKS